MFEDALNDTLAQESLPSDASFILDLVLDNILGSLGLLAKNIPTFGLGDDVLGGGLYIGIAAKGDLANIIDGSIGSTPPITFDIPLLDLPPDIDGGGFFTLGGTSNFTQSSAAVEDSSGADRGRTPTTSRSARTEPGRARPGR